MDIGCSMPLGGTRYCVVQTAQLRHRGHTYGLVLDQTAVPTVPALRRCRRGPWRYEGSYEGQVRFEPRLEALGRTKKPAISSGFLRWAILGSNSPLVLR
jgi:hypothetical protein